MKASDKPLMNMLLENNRVSKAPLADKLRPKTIEDFLGNPELIGGEMPLRNLIEQKELVSIIFWGPPGSGKTTLARIIANHADAHFIELNAVSSGIKELRGAIDVAKHLLQSENKQTVIFIDEIHRYSKTQQDAILTDLEQGNIILIGATTENPSFQVIPALLSRLLVMRLSSLSEESIEKLIQKSKSILNQLELNHESINFLVRYANGDGRSVLNLLETAYKCTKPIEGKRNIQVEMLEKLAQQSRVNYDKDGDNHYDLASAYQKSMRGSDPDAALYWLAKMIAGGEDPRFIARRLIICASEDVGLADPMAFVLASAAFDAVEKLGWPEARIPLAQATAYVAKASKSNKAYLAVDSALADIQKNGKNFPVPEHLRDAHYKDAKKYGHGEGYLYSHNHPDVEQNFLPTELIGKKYLQD